jgi:hypothetical protein
MSTFLKVRMAKNRQLGAGKPVELKYNLQTHRYEDIGEKVVIQE